MKTAKEILRQHHYYDTTSFFAKHIENNIIAAMEEYAQQQSIEFVEWKDKNVETRIIGSQKSDFEKSTYIYNGKITKLAELYNIFCELPTTLKG